MCRFLQKKEEQEMDREAAVLYAFINWWDGWATYGELDKEAQEFVDKFLADHHPDRTSKVSPKSTEEVK